MCGEAWRTQTIDTYSLVWGLEALAVLLALEYAICESCILPQDRMPLVCHPAG